MYKFILRSDTYEEYSSTNAFANAKYSINGRKNVKGSG